MTLGSLFDGIGGWQLAAVHAGVKPIWSSEIEHFPCEVTKHHFPDTVQLGDITKIDADRLESVDIVCAGSPCQDLSVAGKREGLKGERSGLFVDAIRLVRRLRERTGKPRYFVWENVPGAFSSNKGLDFRAVLEEISQTEIPMPKGGKWANAGVVEWGEGSLAWRVLDAQYWGVAQRRKRIFLVADFAGHSAGEILFESQSVLWDSEEGGEAREGTATGTESVVGAAVVRMRAGKPGGGKGALVSRERSLTLAANANDQILFAAGFKAGQSSTGGLGYEPEKAAADEVMRRIEGGKCQTLNARMGTGGNQVPVISYAIAGNIIGRKDWNGGHQMGIDKEMSYTLNTVDRHAVFTQQAIGQYKETGKASSIKSRDYKSATDLVAAVDCRNGNEGEINGTLQAKPNGGTSLNLQNVVRVQKTIRRLTPTECERLQGLPDNYTLIDDKSCSDSARYKALGNGMAQPVADYVIRRIVSAVKLLPKEE